ncbi:MAG: hypothetical protein RJA70_1158 [Pseudomonadota bacterium]|jgi:ubiquinone/menaquinone biosynthesis C-methylase UbiE
MPKGRKSKRGFAGQAELGVVSKLSAVREQRTPFVPLTETLIAEVLAKFGLRGLLVEIGAGDGQLRALLTASVRSRVVHTEPSALGVKKFKATHTDADIRCAAAEALPFEDNSVDAVVGLCVLDIVKDGEAVAQECARVLKPGGCFIHLLDMSVEPLLVVSQLQAAELMLLPNVFSDPCAKAWPEDMVAAPLAQVQRLVVILERARHPSAGALRKYLAVFMASPFSARRAAAAYTAIMEDGNARKGLFELLRAAGQLATSEEQAELARFEGYPFSGAQFLDRRLREWFSAERGFAIAQSDMLATAHICPRLPNERAYLSLAAGHVRHLSEPPVHRLCETAPRAGEGERLVEQSIYAFVAQKS